MTRSRRSVVQFIGAAVLVLTLGACAQEPTASQGEPAQLRVQAGTAGSAVATLVVTVTAPDIATPLGFNLSVQDGVASGTITIPAGSARLITLRAYNAANIETHHGSVTINVVAGNNPTVTVVLEPLAGNRPIVAQVGSVTILISPQGGTLSVGDTVRLSATIIDAGGDTVRSSAGWATLTPSVVRVDTAGLVTAVGTGSGQIVATYAGFGAAAQIEVRGSMGVIAQRLAAGHGHTCALTSSGAAYCWGANWSGQLGDGTWRGGIDSVNFSRSSPVAVSGSLTFSALAAGDDHTCALTGSGAAYCWGGGPPTSSSIPVVVAGGLRFSALATSSGHACGVTSAGAAYCWGYNGYGQLGDGSTTSRSTPVAVAGGLSFSALATGSYHTCGLTGSGAAYCWGHNGDGRLGDGSTTSRSTPVAVAGGLTFRVLAAASQHTCGLTDAGAAYCWGWNGQGQLGDGSTTSRSSPVAVSGSLTFSALAAGSGMGEHWPSSGSHTCALTGSGAAYCWGENNGGELGDGGTKSEICEDPPLFEAALCSRTPVAVFGGLSFSAITVGSFHTCGLTTAGAAYCWGSNDWGQLGSSTPNSSIPVAVTGGLTFGALAMQLNRTRGANDELATFK